MSSLRRSRVRGRTAHRLRLKHLSRMFLRLHIAGRLSPLRRELAPSWNAGPEANRLGCGIVSLRHSRTTAELLERRATRETATRRRLTRRICIGSRSAARQLIPLEVSKDVRRLRLRSIDYITMLPVTAEVASSSLVVPAILLLSIHNLQCTVASATALFRSLPSYAYTYRLVEFSPAKP